jgi:hypothetical protein
MNPQTRPIRSGRAAMLLVACCAAMTSTAWAQEKFKVAFDTPAANTKYTQQHAVDVGDAPGHQIRLFEIQRTYPTDAPMVGGMRLKESWVRGLSDFRDLNGPAQLYAVYVMDNGDRIFAQGALTAHGTPQADGKMALKNLVYMSITGGTGKFASVRGSVRAEGTANPASGFNANRTEIEYWMAK